jgi:pimeloyl-ACP methyl ester carboxylesterase
MAPGAAARTTARAFLTPMRHRGSRAADEVALAGAEPFVVRRSGTRLRAWRFGSGPAVLLLHGWAGRAAQLAPLARAVAEAGCTAVAFDAPAHGGSGGRIASVFHFADALDAFAHACGARAAIGHSMGGAAVAFAAARGLQLDAIAVLGAPRSPEPFFDAFSTALRLGPGERHALRAEIERQVGIPMRDVDLPALAPRATTPLLVVHDRDDREVPFGDGAALASAWPGSEFMGTQGLGHRRLLRDPEVISAVVSFVRAHLARCACGRLASVGGRCCGCALADDLWERGDQRASGGRTSAPLHLA